LSLEGIVEWRHHLHLVHSAEASLHSEIVGNSQNIDAALKELDQEQRALVHDAEMLKAIIRNSNDVPRTGWEIGFKLLTFQDVSWKTAQNTGALSYMSYAQAQEYSEIYSTQTLLETTEQQGVRDAIISSAAFRNTTATDPNPDAVQAAAILQNIEVQEGQLDLVEKILSKLATEYKEFLAAHPSEH
jgi:hypothetical protein